MQYVEHKLDFAEAFTIQLKTSYSSLVSSKIYRTAKAAQKAADKAKAKDGEMWEVLPLNLSYKEMVEEEQDHKALERAKIQLPQILKHLEDNSIKVETFSVGIHDQINIIRWEPLDPVTHKIKNSHAKGDKSLIVEVTMKYTIDI